MNKNIGIIFGFILLLVIAGGIYASMDNKNDAMMVEEKMGKEVMEDSKIAESEKEMMDDARMEDKNDVMMKVGSYEAYSSEKIARADGGDVVLFFHASWCPSCRGLNSDIENNKNSIPEGVSILKTDYDKEVELKKKYGVTTQHTLVQVDKDGNLIKKWSGSPKLASLVSEIK